MQGDQAIKSTANDALASKNYATNIGYFVDPFVSYLTSESQKRLPLINRGYWARVHRIHKTIEEFLQNPEPSKQIISLGAGFDTTYFNFKQRFPDTQFTYIEVDFPDICCRKIEKFCESPEITRILNTTLDKNAEIVTLDYKLLHGDLREWQELEQKLRNYTLKEGPTLVIAECVFSYIDSERIDGLIGMISELYDNAAFIVYDFVGPNDAFGRTMLSNLSARGIELRGISRYPTVKSQNERFLRVFQRAQGFDMLQIYNQCVDVQERNSSS